MEELPGEIINVEILSSLPTKDLISFCETNKDAWSRCSSTSFWGAYIKNKTHEELQDVFTLLAWRWKTDMLYSLISAVKSYNKTIDDVSLCYSYLYYKENALPPPHSDTPSYSSTSTVKRMYDTGLGYIYPQKQVQSQTEKSPEDPILEMFLSMIKLNSNPANLVADLRSYDPLNTKKYIEKVKLALSTNNFVGIHSISNLLPQNNIFYNYAHNLVYSGLKSVLTTLDPLFVFMLDDSNNEEDIETIFLLSALLVTTAAQNDNPKLALETRLTVFRNQVQRMVSNSTSTKTRKVVGRLHHYLMVTAFGIVEECTYDQVIRVLFDEKNWVTVADVYLVPQVADYEVYKTLRKYYPFTGKILESAFRCMSPEEWLVELSKINTKNLSNEEKIEIMDNIADKAFGEGYTYFSQTVKKELERIEMEKQK